MYVYELLIYIYTTQIYNIIYLHSFKINVKMGLHLVMVT